MGFQMANINDLTVNKVDSWKYVKWYSKHNYQKLLQSNFDKLLVLENHDPSCYCSP